MIFQDWYKEIIRKINNLYIDIKKLSNEALYLVAFEVIKDEHLTDAFLLSEFGGFEKSEITKIKKRANLN